MNARIFYVELESKEDKLALGQIPEEERLKLQTEVTMMHKIIKLFEDYFFKLERAEFFPAYRSIIRFPINHANAVLGAVFFQELGFLISEWQNELLLFEK